MDYLNYKDYIKYDVLAEFLRINDFNIKNSVFFFNKDGEPYINKSGELVRNLKVEVRPIENKIKRFFLGSKRKFYFGVKNYKIEK